MLVGLLFRVVESNGMVELESSFNPGAADQQPQVNTAYRCVVFVVVVLFCSGK